MVLRTIHGGSPPGKLVLPTRVSACSSPLHPFFPAISASFPRLQHLGHHHLRDRGSRPLSALSSMDGPGADPLKEVPVGLDTAAEEEYASQSRRLQDFTNISSIDRAWVFNSDGGLGSLAMFSLSQPNLLANKKRRYILSSCIRKESQQAVSCQWAPFPIEMTGASTMVPSPSGSKLLVVRNSDNEAATQLEIWGSFQLEKEFQVPLTIHGQVYTDGWFEGISWNSDETFIAYVAESPSPCKPTFNNSGYKKSNSAEKDSTGCWKGQGDWQEHWGETYAGKRQPSLFVIDVSSGVVHAVEGIDKSLNAGQVVWAPQSKGSHQYLVFVGWMSNGRKLGMKYCYNRPCALYAVRAACHDTEDNQIKPKDGTPEDVSMVQLTQNINSAFFPRFSPDGKFLAFLSSKSSVDSGAHSATDSLHRIDWPTDGKLPTGNIIDVIPVVMCAEDGDFPGIYWPNILSKPWLSDGRTLILSSIWGSTQVIISVNILSANVVRISPSESIFSWNVLALDGNNIVAVCSSPVNVPQLKYGCVTGDASERPAWSWMDISSPLSISNEKIEALLSSLEFKIMKIPVSGASQNITKGACKPFEAIFVASKAKKSDGLDPLIIILHGGPHSVATSSFSKSLAFLSSIGFNLLIVNYRGSLGFGEEALQSLLGKVGSQDVDDVVTAIDYVIDMGLADPNRITVLGGSHGGFLTTHLIGQVPDKFAAAAVRNPVCNMALMVGTTDIPDWCYVEALGSEGRSVFTEAPPPDQLTLFYSKSPISHLSKVRVPTLFLFGAQDLRVPVSNGMQYARALKELGAEVKVIVFPNDTHAIERPQSDFECFLNIGVWFKKHCK